MSIQEAIQLAFSLPDKLNILEKERDLFLLEEEMNRDDFWFRPDASEKSQQISKLKKEITEIRSLESDADTLTAMLEEMSEEEIINETNSFLEKINNVKYYMLFDGRYDHCGASIKISAGVGGSDAEDWTAMLARMYARYFEIRHWRSEVIDQADTDDGIKSITFTVEGEDAYGFLRREKGVHRLIRLSPFKPNSSRQTSFALIEVMPIIERDDSDILPRAEDLEITTSKASGAGGQHVNKTESAIRIVHKPTGTVAECSSDRSQMMNKENAMKLLIGRLALLREEEYSKQMANLKGEKQEASFGSQKRTVTLQPYKLVKDHSTGWETGDTDGYLDGKYLDDIVTSSI